MCTANLHSLSRLPQGGKKKSIMLLENSRSYSGRAEERADHFVPTTPHSRSHLNLICVAGTVPCFRRGRNEGSDDCKEFRGFAKLPDDIAGMVGDQMAYFQSPALL